MRKVAIKVGDRVFDVKEMRAGFVTEIKMADDEQIVYTLRADDDWNKKFMDLDAEEDKAVWDTEAENDVYQFAPGKVDHINGLPVCYEHMPTDDDYPYYSPVLNENLYYFEVLDEQDF